MARRDPCSGCGALTTMASGTCQTCAPTAKRKRTPCLGCETGTTAADGYCRTCRPTYMKQGPIKYDHAVWVDAAPGDWKLIRGVRRWVPKKEKVA